MSSNTNMLTSNIMHFYMQWAVGKQILRHSNTTLLTRNIMHFNMWWAEVGKRKFSHSNTTLLTSNIMHFYICWALGNQKVNHSNKSTLCTCNIMHFNLWWAEVGKRNLCWSTTTMFIHNIRVFLGKCKLSRSITSLLSSNIMLFYMQRALVLSGYEGE